MVKLVQFNNVSVLIADADPYLSRVVISQLRAMGFHRIQFVKSFDDAMRCAQVERPSFIITEWNLDGAPGVDLVRYIRTAKDSRNRCLPIIMLTGRGELSDVCEARDAGVTEFVVKPFNVQTLYSRIEQIVEYPRSFVMAASYAGPERRRREPLAALTEDRRIIRPTPHGIASEGLEYVPGTVPRIYLPDTTLRKKMGITEPLSHVITQEVRAKAEEVLEDMAAETQQWIEENLDAMRVAYEHICATGSPTQFMVLKDLALTLKSRAGTLGYFMAGDIAKLLHFYLATEANLSNTRHLKIIDKYLEAIEVVIANRIKQREGAGAELYSQLQRLLAAS